MHSVTDISLRRAYKRQFVFALCVLAVFGVGFILMTDILSAGGFTALEIVILALFAVLFAQIAFGAAVALMGFYVLRRGGDPFRITNTLPANQKAGPLPGIAVVMPIFNEDVARVFQGLRVVYESLQRTGQAEAFDFFVLSDSNDPNCWIEEEKTWLELCKQVDGFGRIFYRKRRVTLNHKSGNVADFCRRWGAHYRYMIVLDADSLMTGEVLVKLVQLMERNPSAGIIQTMPKMVLGKSLFSRIQQFAAHLYGPIFCAGANFWHLGGGNYWGHNAIIRLKPFMEYCALPELPKVGRVGGRILSHDSVEAALMRRAGYGVWFAYDLEGSYEEGPPDLLSSLKRDFRWCQGNMQHLLVLMTRGLKPASRIHLLIGILSFASAPLWLLFLLLTTLAAGKPAAPITSGLHIESGFLFGYVILLLFLPKLLVLLRAWKMHAQCPALANRLRVFISVIAETIFSMLLAPILMIAYTKFVFSALTGFQMKWGKQNRGEARPGWRETLRAQSVATLLGIAGLVTALWLAPAVVPWLMPVLAGLIFAIPFARLTSSAVLGERARYDRLFLIPEEVAPPWELQRVDERILLPGNSFFRQEPYAIHYGLLQAVLDPYIHAMHVSLLRWRESAEDTDRPHLAILRKKLLAEGPASLAPEERAVLLWDPDSMTALHKELWICGAENLADWWRDALRNYNETIAVAARRKFQAV